VTLCADEPWLDPTLPQKVYFEMKMYAGYQHLYTLVYNEDGEYVATVYPAQGLRETTWIETSCAGGRLRGVAETVEQPTLAVDVRLEDGQPGMSSAEAGYYYSIDGAFRKYYSVEVPSYTQTELIAIQALELPGFVFVRWEGNGVALDSEGNVREDVTLSPFVGAGQPYTERLIYVKCQDSWLAPTSRELTAVFRPCTHCGHASTTDAGKSKGTRVGELVGDEPMQNTIGCVAKSGISDIYGCRWYVHKLLADTGNSWYTQYYDSTDIAYFVVTGISLQHGGYRAPSNSHQNGLDVDVRYLYTDGDLDVEASVDLISLFLTEECKYVFVEIPDVYNAFDGHDSRVRFQSPHTDHFHVRFADPDGGPEDDPCPPCQESYP